MPFGVERDTGGRPHRRPGLALRRMAATEMPRYADTAELVAHALAACRRWPARIHPQASMWTARPGVRVVGGRPLPWPGGSVWNNTPERV